MSDDPTRDAAIRALCDFAEQPHPGRAGEAIDALERHLRASQPQPARHNLYGWPECKACGGSGAAHEMDSDADHGICPSCNGLGLLVPVQNQPHPAKGEAGREGPSDGQLAMISIRAMAQAEREGVEDLDEKNAAGNRAIYNAGLSHARSDAEAMRRVCEAAARLVGLWNRIGTKEQPLATLEEIGPAQSGLVTAVNALPASLRPKKGTPDGK